MGFPCGSAGKESASNEGDLGLISGLGRSPGEGKGYPLQYSGLENSMDRTVHRDAKSRTRLSDFHFQFRLSIKALSLNSKTPLLVFRIPDDSVLLDYTLYNHLVKAYN